MQSETETHYRSSMYNCILCNPMGNKLEPEHKQWKFKIIYTHNRMEQMVQPHPGLFKRNIDRFLCWHRCTEQTSSTCPTKYLKNIINKYSQDITWRYAPINKIQKIYIDQSLKSLDSCCYGDAFERTGKIFYCL